jgi:glycosyltransferase involved in cell wall biosynthesis
MTAPRVTVLMSVYNGAAFLASSVESILAQTFRDLELLVVDDGSTDGSAGILDRYRSDPRLTVVANERNLGLTRSLNVGLRAARGELVARQDADDLSHPQRLARQVAFLDAHPDVALVGTQATGLRSLHAWPKCTGSLSIRWQLMFDSPFLHTAVMFRRGIVWGELGGYDESFRTNQDYELWTRLAAHHELRNLREALVIPRTPAASVSRGYRESDLERVREVCVRYRTKELRSSDLACLGLDDMLSINNIGTRARPADLSPLLKMDVDMFRRFVALNPAAAGDTDIRRHRAVSLARVACTGARHGSAGSARLFAHACGLMPGLLPRWSGRFAAFLLLGVAARRARLL